MPSLPENENNNSHPMSLALTPALSEVCSNLLVPTSKTLGEALDQKIKNLLDKNRASNLGQHIEKAQKFAASQNFKCNIDGEDAAQLSLFKDWAENAQDIKPENTELAALWQALLVKIANGETDTKELLRILKNLSASEAQMLIQASGGTKIRSNEYPFTSLNSKGLIAKNYKFIMRYSFYSVFFIAASILGYISKKVFFLKASPYGEAMILLLLAGALLLYFWLLASFLIKPFWRLTWLGHELVRYVPKDIESSLRGR